MATVLPFKGLRYTGKAGHLMDLIAPPYDVLSPEERDAYAAKSPSNIVHVTLPEARGDDRSKFVKYARSSALIEQLRGDGFLAAEDRPVFYRYRQTFLEPGTRDRYERTALIGLLKLEPYENGVVLPHEQTFPKHKEDRLRLLEATRAHLECIFGLYEDDGEVTAELLGGAEAQPLADVKTEDGVEHVLDLIDRPETVSRLRQALEPKRVWIADGHHRYETALSFRAAQPALQSPCPEDYMMMALSSMRDPGLLLMPTHRIVAKLPFSIEEVAARLAPSFDIRPCPNHFLMDELPTYRTDGEHAFGLVAAHSEGRLLILKQEARAAALAASSGSERLRSLDVTILHEYIFRELLGLPGTDGLEYTRDPRRALEAVGQGAAAAFLMAPPTVDDMRHIALGNEKMPQKSTYYYPKLQSGLVMWSMSDFER